ncbi:hypothetical protein U1Q18_052345, partial [Sarracenia purpurea var. burkii]
YSAALIFHLAFHPVQPAAQRRRSKNTSANTRKVARRSTTVATLDNDAPAEDTTIDPIILADPLLRKDFKFKRGYYFIHNINPKPIYVSEIIHTISQFDEKQGRTAKPSILLISISPSLRMEHLVSWISTTNPSDPEATDGLLRWI